MATPFADGKPRKKRFTSKVRTGCQTCKIRRIKCDEERPNCHGCVSTGRTCDGYDAIRLVQPQSQKDGTLVLKYAQPSPTPSAYPPESSGREQAAFHAFRQHILDDLVGPFDATVWQRQVLPLSMTEPAVWHAVVALGSLAQARHNETFGEATQYALQHYSKAVKDLQGKIAGNVKVPTNLILLICLLFVTFEYRQLAYGEAQSHLTSGLNIIREYENALDVSSEPAKDVIDPLIEVFERLDVQNSSFTSTAVQLKRSERTWCATSGMDQPFQHVSDAMRGLNHQIGAMRDLDYAVETQRFSPNGISSCDHTRFHNKVVRQLHNLYLWKIAVEDLTNRQIGLKDRICVHILQMRWMYCKLKVSNCLSDGRECFWDNYLPDFEQIILLAESVASIQTSTSRTNGEGMFCLDTGIIPPVYFTVLKCRDPELRRRALTVLRDCKQQEGAWSGPIIARIAGNIMKLEERGIDDICKSADVPEMNRLYQGYYDLRYSDKLVYCKRRRFESDGAWLAYTLLLD